MVVEDLEAGGTGRVGVGAVEEDKFISAYSFYLI